MNIEDLLDKYAKNRSSDYLKFFHDYPDIPNGCDDICEHECLKSLAHIDYLNEGVRSKVMKSTVEWPQHYFIIGESGSGDMYCIDTMSSPSKVIFWDHDMNEFRTIAACTLDFFINTCNERQKC